MSKVIRGTAVGVVVVVGIFAALWGVQTLAHLYGRVEYNGPEYVYDVNPRAQAAGYYQATVICPNIAEDSAAHLRLVDYEAGPDGTVWLTYRCERKGY